MSKCHSAFHGILSPIAYIILLGFSLVPLFGVSCVMLVIDIIQKEIASGLLMFFVINSLSLVVLVFGYRALFKYYINSNSVKIKLFGVCIKEIPLKNANIQIKSLIVRDARSISPLSRDRYILISTPDVDLYSFFFDTELEIKDIMKKNVIPIPYEARFALYNAYKENFGCDKDDKTFAALEKIVKSDS